MKALQDQYAPNSICFGCGPSNEKGLQIKSFPKQKEDGSIEVVCEWKASDHHRAFPGMLAGGIAGNLLDCHSNWTAAYVLMKEKKASEPDCTVTARYDVKLKRPIPVDGIILLKAHPVEIQDDRVTVDATLEADGKVCATCTGLFVAVKPGHPAYHRWN